VISGLAEFWGHSLRPESIATVLRKAVQGIDPDLPLQDIRTRQEQIDSSMRQERIIAALTSSFGVLAEAADI
jgi:hypothetical protein